MSKINIRESLRNMDADSCCKYDLLTMYDACLLTDEDKADIAKLLFDNEDPEVIYQKLCTYFCDDDVSELTGLNDVQNVTPFEAIINNVKMGLEQKYDSVFYNDVAGQFEITSKDTTYTFGLSPVEYETDGISLYVDYNYDVPINYTSIKEASEDILNKCKEKVLTASQSNAVLDDDTMEYTVYDVVEDEGRLCAKCMNESTNSFEDIKLGKVNSDAVNELLNNILNNPNYKLTNDCRKKIADNSAPWGIVMSPSFDITASNALMSTGDFGGSVSFGESEQCTFENGDRVTDGNRKGTVIDCDSVKVLVEWDYSETDDIEWVDKSELSFVECLKESEIPMDTVKKDIESYLNHHLGSNENYIEVNDVHNIDKDTVGVEYEVHLSIPIGNNEYERDTEYRSLPFRYKYGKWQPVVTESKYDIKTKTTARKLVDKAKADDIEWVMKEDLSFVNALKESSEDEAKLQMNNKYDKDIVTEGIFDSKETKQKRYADAVKDVFGEDVNVVANNVISYASDLLQEVADSLGDESSSKNLGNSIIRVIKNAQATINKTPHSLVRNIASIGQKYERESINLKELQDFLSKVGKLQNSGKDGYKAMQFLFDKINNSLSTRIDAIIKTITNEYGLIRESNESIQEVEDDQYFTKDDLDEDAEGYVNLREAFEDTDELELKQVQQEFSSAATSINSNKLPAIYNMVEFRPGDVVVDFGGGKFDNAVNYLKDKDVTLLVYDPYNRSAEHNKEVLRILKEHGGADAAVNSNVLNVIKEPEAREAVLKNIKKITKRGAPIYITVYEGRGDGAEGPTKSGYQLNRKTSDYMDEVGSVFSNVKRKGKLITAINESTKHIKSSRNETFQNDKRLSSTSTNVPETQMIDDLEYFYEVYPEAMEPILIRNGATPDKDNWLDGCNIPQAYNEAVAYFESKYDNDDEYSELDTGVGSRLGWSNYIQSGIYEGLDSDDYVDDWRELASKSVEDSDGFNTDYTLYTNGETYICMFGDKDLYEPDEAYADYETESEQDAWDWFNSYTGFADEEDEYYDILESTEVVNSGYSPDLLNELVNYYSSFDTMSSEEIWDEIVARYNNEALANDVLESLDGYGEDFDFADEEDEIREVFPDANRKGKLIVATNSRTVNSSTNIKASSTEGYVYTYCDECGKKNRVKVTFNNFNEPFNDTEYKCKYCGANNLLTDPHSYDKNGNLVEASHDGGKVHTESCYQLNKNTGDYMNESIATDASNIGQGYTAPVMVSLVTKAKELEEWVEEYKNSKDKDVFERLLPRFEDNILDYKSEIEEKIKDFDKYWELHKKAMLDNISEAVSILKNLGIPRLDSKLEKLNERYSIKDVKEFLDEIGGYADYDGKIEELMDNFGMTKDEAESAIQCYVIEPDDDYDIQKIEESYSEEEWIDKMWEAFQDISGIKDISEGKNPNTYVVTFDTDGSATARARILLKALIKANLDIELDSSNGSNVFTFITPTNEWEFIKGKMIKDSDGFLTSYDWYRNTDSGLNIFMFGEDEADPDYADWETESDAEAEDWFNSYTGFDEEELD